MTDYAERTIKAKITRLRNIAKATPMSLLQKLAIFAQIKQADARLREHRLSKV